MRDITNKIDFQGGLMRGDSAIIGSLYRILKDLARRNGIEEGEIDDLAQETMVRLITHPDSYDPERNFVNWAYGILVNRYRDSLDRKRIRKHPSVYDRQIEGKETGFEEYEDPIKGRLREAVDTLPSEGREIVDLMYGKRWSIKKVARGLGCPPGTAKSRLSSTLRTLRRKLVA